MKKILLHIMILAVSMMAVALGLLACYTQKHATAMGLTGVFWLTVRHTYRAMHGNEPIFPLTDASLFVLLAAAGLLL